MINLENLQNNPDALFEMMEFLVFLSCALVLIVAWLAHLPIYIGCYLHPGFRLGIMPRSLILDAAICWMLQLDLLIAYACLFIHFRDTFISKNLPSKMYVSLPSAILMVQVWLLAGRYVMLNGRLAKIPSVTVVGFLSFLALVLAILEIRSTAASGAEAFSFLSPVYPVWTIMAWLLLRSARKSIHPYRATHWFAQPDFWTEVYAGVFFIYVSMLFMVPSF